MSNPIQFKRGPEATMPVGLLGEPLWADDTNTLFIGTGAGNIEIQPAGSYITALTGDGTASGPGSAALTLATVNAGVGTFGSATQAAVITANAKGLITAISQTTITPAASSITSPGALSSISDTNVTLTLGGSPTVSLLAATSLTLGWTGQLAVSRGGTGVDTASANRVFAGPTSGGAAAPSFRSLVTSDIPDLSAVYQPLDADLTSWAAVTRASGFDTFAATPSSVNLRSLLTDETGTGAAVFATSPALTTPVITGITDGSSASSGILGEVLIQSRLRSAATGLTTATPANITATALTLTAGDWDISAFIGFTAGTATSITSCIAAISLTSAALPASDTTSVPTSGEVRTQMLFPSAGTVPPNNGVFTMQITKYQFTINASTTLYLVAQAAFTVSTLSVFGSIEARRIR